MAKVVVIGGEQYIIAKPSSAFRNSSMIRSISESGREIAVNLNTGNMIIYKMPPEKSCHFKLDNLEITISKDRDVGLLQIEDQVDKYLREKAENLKNTDVRFYITSEDTILFLTSLNSEDFTEFMRQVSYAYRRFIG